MSKSGVLGRVDEMVTKMARISTEISPADRSVFSLPDGFVCT
jgi:hypothetical protein